MTVALDLLRSGFVSCGTPIAGTVVKGILDPVYLPLVRVE